MARDSIITTDITSDNRLTITVQGFPTIVIDPAGYNDEARQAAMLHGFKQKYADKAALGADASPAEKHAAIMRMVQWHRDGGDWNMTASGDGTSGDGLLCRAIMEATGIDRDAAREAVGAMDKKTQAAMRASAELAPIIARIRAEKPAPKVAAIDATSLLAGLRARG